MKSDTIEAVAAIILKAVNLGPHAIQTVADAKPFAEIIIGAIGGKKLAAEQIIEMEAKGDALVEEFLRPLPQEEGT